MQTFLSPLVHSILETMYLLLLFNNKSLSLTGQHGDRLYVLVRTSPNAKETKLPQPRERKSCLLASPNTDAYNSTNCGRLCRSRIGLISHSRFCPISRRNQRQ